MGTINYFTSNYVTLGYDLSGECYEDDFYRDYIDDEYNEIKVILENERFYYFHVTLKPGYYDGFSIDIENNFSYCFDDYGEKLQALKEITRIKNALLYIVNNFNVCACSPGWCTGYYDYKDTINRINDAILEMKNETRTTPTYYTLKAAKEG